MPVGEEREPRVTETFVARASELGFSNPPIPLRLKLIEGPSYWTLFIQAVPSGPPHGVTDWLEPYAPHRLEFGRHHVIRADFAPLPDAWGEALRGITLDTLQLDPSGQALIVASGSRAALAAFTRRVRGPTVRLDITHVGVAAVPVRLLTAPQDQALRAAVGSGYYLIPRPVNLRQLALRLTISSASLSERLRRAEGRILTRYVNEGGRSPWDQATLYDEQPLEEDASIWDRMNDRV